MDDAGAAVPQLSPSQDTRVIRKPSKSFRPHHGAVLAFLFARMKRYEFWRHRPSGELWAVVVENETVISATGPVAPSDAAVGILHYLPFDPRHAAWVRQHRAEFSPSGASA